MYVREIFSLKHTKRLHSKGLQKRIKDIQLTSQSSGCDVLLARQQNMSPYYYLLYNIGPVAIGISLFHRILPDSPDFVPNINKYNTEAV